MSYLAKNNAYSTLAGSITNIATTLTVAAGHGDRFPAITAPDYTNITLEDASGNREIVKVTARAAASDTMTIERAQESTLARAWAAGDIVELRFTAGILVEYVNAVLTHMNDTVDSHDASAISNVPSGNLAATNVQDALNEIQTELDAKASSTSLSDHIADTADAHDASAISYAGGTDIAATDVEGALDELATEKLNKSGGALTGLLSQAAGADIASATSVDLTAATGNVVTITGTVPVTAFVMNAGQQMELIAAAALPLTYHATTMNIDGGVSYTCAIGDRIRVIKDLAGVIRANIFKKDGKALVQLAASETVAGAIELATQAEVDAGTDAVRAVTPVTLKAATSLGIAVGQTWQNVSGSRTSGVTYTNSTGKPIMVAMGISSTNGFNKIDAYVSGIYVGNHAEATPTSTSGGGSVSFIVPNGASYVITHGGTRAFWAELR